MTNEELIALCEKQEKRIKSLEYSNKMLWTMIDIVIEAWKTSIENLRGTIKK